MTQTQIAPMEQRVVEEKIETTSDKNRAAHIVYVPSGSNTTAYALVLAARIEGFEVEALCGHRWIPQQDPKKYPVCQECLEVYQQPGDNRDSRNELPDA